MLILGADTSGKYGSIALVRCDAEALRTVELVPLQGGTFSAQMIPQIAELFSKHGLHKTDIDGFAVASGPGSFTGLRVGLAAIKALAEILEKPIASVSLLEVIAFELRSDENKFVFPRGQRDAENSASTEHALVVVTLDAGRNETYVGEYQIDEELPVGVSESLLTFDELGVRASRSQRPVYTPDESVIAALSGRDARVLRVPRPNAVSVARLGYKKILAGLTLSPLELDANYIRRADAEIKTVRKPA